MVDAGTPGVWWDETVSVTEACPFPEGREGPASPWTRWSAIVHVFFYGALAGGIADVLPDASDGERALVGALVAFVAGWYGYWVLLRPERRTGPRQALFFAGLLAAWLGLLSVDTAFVVLALPAYAVLLAYLPFGAAMAAAGLVTAMALGAEELSGRLEVGDVLGAGVTLAVVAFCGSFMRAVVVESRERQRLIAELEETRDELARSERRAGTLDERGRLAREIHDTLAQGFVSIVTLLEAAQASLRTGSGAAPGHVEDALRAARQHLEETRRVVWALRPSALDDGDLRGALERAALSVERANGPRVRVVTTGDALPVPEAVTSALLRVAGEALTNAQKHAEASEVTVTLSYLDDVVALDVCDDGVGFHPEGPVPAPGPDGGLGLAGMRERADELGGRLAIESVPGEGTTVSAELPLHPRGSTHPLEGTHP